MKSNSKSGSGSTELGLSEQQKFDAKKPLRGETSEATQRPVANKESMSSDRGTFKTK